VATEAQAPQELVERVQDLLGSLDDIADPVAQARVQELVGAVLRAYRSSGRTVGECIRRTTLP